LVFFIPACTVVLGSTQPL